MTLLDPFQPDDQRPWNRARASHLLRRAGFAPRESEVQTVLGKRDDIAGLVNTMVVGTEESPRCRELDPLGERLAIRNEIGRLRGWWLLRMLHTSRPLAARMALFWHDHFATSFAKVPSASLMLKQLRTIEQLALGRFEDLLLAMSRDPAMIIWLDGNTNVKGRPNENYARELFELFALGVGNYTENDVLESARAFTGWHQYRGEFVFRENDHDTGRKHVLGMHGSFTGEEVVQIVVAHDACSVFLSKKLLEEFVCDEPSEDLVNAFAKTLRDTRLDIGESLRVLLASRAMFDEPNRRARIKSPVEYVIGMARSLEVDAAAEPLADATEQMGQALFEPPSVKGWDGHRAWINSATMLVRLNAAVRALGDEGPFDAEAFVARHGIETRGAGVEFASNLALDGDLPEALRTRLQSIQGDPAHTLRNALRLLFTSPEYQLA